MKLEFEITNEEVQKIVADTVREVIKQEVTKKSREHFKSWMFEESMSAEISKYLRTKAPQLVDKVFEDYEGIKERAVATITNSMAQRVARAAKRMED